MPLPEGLAVLRTFRVLVLDADGVWWDGNETRGVLSGGDVVVFKTRDMRDGQGLSFLRAIGIQVLFASGEKEPLGSVVEKLNELPSVANGSWKPISCLAGRNAKGAKVDAINGWLEENGFGWEDVVYIGDDLNDLEAGAKAALFVTPGDAQTIAKERAGLTLERDGGAGAIRELADYVLALRGTDAAQLPPA